MPPAILPIAGLAMGGAQAAGGKKGQKKANAVLQQQLALQQQAQQYGRGLVDTGMTNAWQPADTYWNTLLKGDPNAVAQAVGPYSDQIRNQSQAASREMAVRMPAGGEANAAQGANALQASNAMARLFAGMQPSAAEHLGQLSTIPIGAGVSVMGQGAPQVGAGLSYLSNANQQASNAKGSAGEALGGSASKLHNQVKNPSGGGGKGGRYSSSGVPSMGDYNYNPTNAAAPGFSQLPTEPYT